MSGTSHGPWYYEQIELGLNYRLTDMQAALGLSQLSHLDAWLRRRHQLADRYDQALASLPLTLPVRHTDRYSGLHLYVVRVQDGAPMDRAALFSHLRESGVGVNVHYIPVHLQPDYRRFGFAEGDFPHSEAYYRQALTLPLYATLGESDQNRVIGLLKAALS